MPCQPSFSKNIPGLPANLTKNIGGFNAAPSNCGSVSFPTPPAGSPGHPFSIPVVPLPFPIGFPEDLLCIFNLLQFLTPPGTLKPQMGLHSGKDIFDGILKL